MHLRPARYPDLRDGPALWSASKSRRISTRLSCLCFPLATINFTVIQHGTLACVLVAGRMTASSFGTSTEHLESLEPGPRTRRSKRACHCVCVCSSVGLAQVCTLAQVLNISTRSDAMPMAWHLMAPQKRNVNPTFSATFSF